MTVARRLHKRHRFGCEGCDKGWPWILDHRGVTILSMAVRQHVRPDGELLGCSHEALRFTRARL